MQAELIYNPSSGQVVVRHELDDVIAFLDISPQGTGHSLIIPKLHSNNFLEMENGLVEKLFGKTQIIAKRIKESLEAEGVNLLLNIGSAAGQLVFHTHVHIIPRKTKKEFNSLKEVGDFLREKLKK